MPNHLSIVTAIDKNKIASDVVYLILLEVDVIEPTTGAVNNHICITNNNEPYTYKGTSYLSIPFEIEIKETQNNAPSCTLTVIDLAQIFQAELQQYGWSLSWPARFKVINTSNPDGEPELEVSLNLMSATASEENYAVQFEVGAENPLALRFPPRQQFRNRCFWKYKDPTTCKYSGPLPVCDYTRDGSVGCEFHNNTINYGGFPGIQSTIT